MKLSNTILLATLSVLLSGRSALGCATAVGDEDDPVQITGESAVIIWDKQKGIEHFIRRASFDTKNHDFGFLVPTPSRPTLSKAGEAIFTTLEEATEPKVETRSRERFSFEPLLVVIGRGSAEDENSEDDSAANNSAAFAAADDDVEVLEESQIGNYHAVVLNARNAAALKNWLHNNGYETRPDLAAWLTPYIKKNWVITAFKIVNQNPGSEDVDSDLVRLSFRTPAPFYPYREPASARVKNESFRSLQVFYIGDTRPSGVVDAPRAPIWPGRVRWSDDLDSKTLLGVSKDLGLGPDQLPTKVRMTAFDDVSSPRPGIGDLFFNDGADQSTIMPPPHVIWTGSTIWIPIDVLTTTAFALCFGIWLLFRRRATNLA